MKIHTIKNYSPLKKLVSGILLLISLGLIMNFIPQGEHIRYGHEVTSFLSNFLPHGLAEFLSDLLFFVINVFCLYAIVVGIFRVFTFGQYIPEFEENSGMPDVGIVGNREFPNINSVLSYRESYMAGLSPEKAADLYRRTSKIDGLYSAAPGPQTMQAVSYLESQLAGMSPDKGLKFLANKLP